MLGQIAHRLPAIEKNRWRALREIYLLHAGEQLLALGKVQLLATQVPSVMLMHRLFTAPLHAEEEGCWVWRCEEILGHGSLPGIVGRGGERSGWGIAYISAPVILECHLGEMSPFQILANSQSQNLSYAPSAAAVFIECICRESETKLCHAFISTSIIKQEKQSQVEEGAFNWIFRTLHSKLNSSV